MKEGSRFRKDRSRSLSNSARSPGVTATAERTPEIDRAPTEIERERVTTPEIDGERERTFSPREAAGRGRLGGKKPASTVPDPNNPPKVELLLGKKGKKVLYIDGCVQLINYTSIHLFVFLRVLN